jgi:hypothetical protein|tara:strand:+ start:3524 stop:3862 length:339 start_codon:yes stop_codon:yes gene_type:complete
MRSSRDLKLVYEIKPIEFSDDIEDCEYPAYIEVTKEVRSWKTEVALEKLYSSEEKANLVIDDIQTRMTNKMMNEIMGLGGFKTRRGSGYDRFNHIKNLITVKFFKINEIEVE